MTQELIGVRKAADVLGLSPSTVSRYLKQYPELNRGSETRPKVDLEELRRHRSENVNGLKSGNHAGRLFDQDGDDEVDSSEAPGREDAPAAGGKTSNFAYTKAKTAREAIAAQKAKIELDQMLDEVTPVYEVQEGMTEAGQIVQNELLAMRREIAEELAAMDDPNEVEARLKEEHRKVLGRMAEAFAKLGGAEVENAA